MRIGQELAVLDFGWEKTAPYLPQNKFVWKILIVFLIFLFSLVVFPWQGSREASLDEESIRDLINQSRSLKQLRPLKGSVKLEQAARAKAEDILRQGYFSHTSPSGAKPWDFIKNTGMPFSFAGENLAINYTSSYELVNDLLLSPSHRENLLSPLFSEVGIAVVKGIYQGQEAIVTVQMFASPLN